MGFMCFGGAGGAVADEAVARHRGAARRGRVPSLIRGKFFSGDKGGKNKKSSELKGRTKASPGRELEDVYDMIAAVRTATAAASSSALSSSSGLSSSGSLDSGYTSSSCRSSSSSTSSLATLELLSSPARRSEVKRSPAAGAAAVLVCFVMVLLCGKVGATMLASAAFYLFPRRWPAGGRADARTAVVLDHHEMASPEHDVSSSMETTKKKVVMGGFLMRNRNK